MAVTVGSFKVDGPGPEGTGVGHQPTETWQRKRIGSHSTAHFDGVVKINCEQKRGPPGRSSPDLTAATRLNPLQNAQDRLLCKLQVII